LNYINIYLKYLYLFIFLFLSVDNYLGADDKNNQKLPIDFYLLGGPNFIYHKTKLPLIYNSADCGIFDNNNNKGYFLGTGINYNILNKLFSIDTRIYIENRNLELNKSSENFEVYNQTNDNYTKLELQHNYKAKLNYLGFEMGFNTQPLNYVPVSFRLGIDYSDLLGNSNFTNTQTIISPDNILFNNQRRTQIIEEGEINNVNTSYGLSFALQSKFSWINNLQVGTEINYRLGLNNLKSDSFWETNILRLNLLVFLDNSIVDSTDLEEKIVIITDIETVKKEILTETPKKQINKTNNINIVKADNLSILETFVTQTYPILPYIFFDSSSANLSNKFIKRYENSYQFDEKKLPHNNLDIYYHILDILGSRLSKSKSNITIVGMSDGLEESNLKSTNSLMSNRANTIKNYLISKWNIDNDKILIKAKVFENKSKIDNQIITDEYRRLELFSDDITLFEPILHSNFIEYTSNKTEQNIDLNYKNKIKDLEIYAIYKDNKIKLEKDFYDLIIDEKNKSIICKFNLNQNYLTKYNKILDYYNECSFEIISKDNYEQNDTNKINFTVFKDQNNYELGRLNLIVFDYNSSDISDINKSMLKNFTFNTIQNNSKTKIIGSTDLVGELTYNYNLSQERADAVANYLISFNKNYKFIEVKGIGPSEIKFDNSNAEGRFYCRTVLIEVKTPIDK